MGPVLARLMELLSTHAPEEIPQTVARWCLRTLEFALEIASLFKVCHTNGGCYSSWCLFPSRCLSALLCLSVR